MDPADTIAQWITATGRTYRDLARATRLPLPVIHYAAVTHDPAHLTPATLDAIELTTARTS